MAADRSSAHSTSQPPVCSDPAANVPNWLVGVERVCRGQAAADHCICVHGNADMRGTSEEDEDDEYVSEESEGDDEVPDEPDEEEEEEPYEEEIVPQVVVSLWWRRSLQSGNMPPKPDLSG